MDDFLLPHECEGLIRAHENHLMESSQHDPIVCFSDQSTMTSYLRLAGVPWSDAIRMTDLLKGVYFTVLQYFNRIAAIHSVNTRSNTSGLT